SRPLPPDPLAVTALCERAGRGGLPEEDRRVLEALRRPALRIAGPRDLGRAYERTLHRPARRGVCYTPPPIVDHIVEHTVGAWLAGTTAKEAAGMVVLDPACGAGAFLLGAYQRLLDFYLAAYLQEGAGHPALVPLPDGGAALGLPERLRILRHHIY